eukprot:2052302-Amphidinium_carterae.2
MFVESCVDRICSLFRWGVSLVHGPWDMASLKHRDTDERKEDPYNGLALKNHLLIFDSTSTVWNKELCGHPIQRTYVQKSAHTAA